MGGTPQQPNLTTSYDWHLARYMYDLMGFHPRVRNVALVGHLHHGKSSIMDMLVNETHEKILNVEFQERYTDTHPLERARGVSIKSMPMTLVMQDTKDVSYLLNVIDTPGNDCWTWQAIEVMKIMSF